MSERVVLKAKAVVGIPTTPGDTTIVCFHPTKKTKTLAEGLTGKTVFIDVEDVTGEWEAKFEMLVTDVYFHEALNVLTVTTESEAV
jgi:hypothetical protein